MGLGSDIRNMFFPGVNGDGGMLKHTQLSPIMSNDAKNLSRYHAPVQLGRLKIDLSYWRKAAAEAERPMAALPYRVKMQTIFIDTIQNGHVFSCLQRRKNLTLLKDFHICDEQGNTDEKATKLLKKKWFKDGLNYILDAQFYGYTLFSFGDLVDGNFPKLRLLRRWEVSPDREVLSTQPYIPTGIMFNDPAAVDPNGISYFDWSLYATTPSENGVSPCGYGLLYKVALYEIILRNLIGWNANFSELFGQPIRWGKTNKDEGDERDVLEKALQEMGSTAYIITDPQDDIVLLNGDPAGTGWKNYDNLEGRFEKIVSSIILGHKDALSSTPGKLGSEQGGEESPIAIAMREVEQIDTDFCEYVINDIWIPKLQILGFPIPMGEVFAFKNDKEKQNARKKEDANNKVTADIAKTLKDAGMKMATDYFTERTGIPVEEAEEPTPIAPSFPKSIKNKLDKTYSGHART